MRKSFDEVFEDVTKFGTKIKTDEYHLSGKYQIIDQGQNAIAGYTDLENGLFDSVPAIIFGDHTRIIKYVDNPFFLGADGTKVLRSRYEDANYRYLYYALRHVKIQNTGYNRHFKWLKEAKINYPNEKRQSEIVMILDDISKIMKYRQQQIQNMDELVKARFVEMFGDPIYNTNNLQMKYLSELGDWASGGTPSRNESKYFEGNINWYSAGELNTLFLDGSVEKITEKAIENSSTKLFKEGSMLIGMYDTAAFKMGILKEASASNQACACITPNEKINIIWLYFELQMMKKYFLSLRRGVRQKNLNLGMIKSFGVPVADRILQDEFATFVHQVNKLKYVAIQAAV